MAFPTLVPTSRSFDAGDWPIKSFRSQNGAEVRILYGSNRTGMSLELSYENLSDANAELFLTHYNEVQGTYGTFTIPATGAKTGWSGTTNALDVTGTGNSWRYAEPPRVQAVKAGVSTVSVKLIGVL